MPVTVTSQGTLQTKVGTEHVITNVISAGVYVWRINASSFVLGDIVTFRQYQSVRSGEPFVLEQLATYVSCQAAPVLFSVPLISVNTAYFSVYCDSAGVSSLTGTGSNGPQISWRVDNVN